MLAQLLALSLLPSARAFSGAAGRPSLRGTRRAASPALADRSQADDELEVWRLREGMVRGVFGSVVNWREDDKEAAEARAALGGEADGSTRTAFVAAAAVTVVGALVLRLGGRAALVSLLGLDLVAELGIGAQIDSVVQYADALGVWAIVAFVAAWTVAKVFLLFSNSTPLAWPDARACSAAPHIFGHRSSCSTSSPSRWPSRRASSSARR